MRKRYRILATLMLLASPSVSILVAQTEGAISGEVTDTSGAAVGGATVTVTNEGTNVSRQTSTNTAGAYGFPSLLPGTYRMRVEMSGFQSEVRNGVLLEVQQAARIDFQLQVGQITETLDVSAAAPLLTTESATVGTVIENKRVVDLPLNGRNYLQLIALSPNVSYGFGNASQQTTIEGGQRATQNISVAGTRSELNHFTLDGIENTDSNFNDYLFLPSIDAIEEFKVQTGVYPAEFGRNVSQINVSTKSGTNDYHGALFEFFRNSKLDANTYQFTSVAPVKNPLVRNQYGYTVGGPVVIPKVFNGKNRLFFMTNYEALRNRTGQEQIAIVPSAAMRNGDFSSNSLPIFDPASRVLSGSTITATPFAGNIIPASRFSSQALTLLQYYPVPNVPGSVGNNYQALEPQRQDADQFTARIDFAESSNSNWFGRWSWDDEFGTTPAQFHNQGEKLTTTAQQAIISNVRVLSPSTVNEFRFGYNRFINANLQDGAYVNNVVGALGGIPGIAIPSPVLWGIPSIGITGFTGFGDTSTAPNLTHNNFFQWIDNFSINRGKHSLRFGAEIRRDRYNQSGNQYPRGSFAFSGQATQNPQSPSNTGNAMADYMLGLIRTSAGSLGLAIAQLRATNQYYYIDDSWRVRPKLTVTLGLRYEFSPPYYDKHGGEINAQIPSLFDPGRPPVLVRAGSGDFYQNLPFVYAPGVLVARDGRLGDALVKSDPTNFAPRVGIAYSPASTWTVRAGFGIFYAQDIGNAWYDMSRNLAVRRNDTAGNNFPNLTFTTPFSSGNFVVAAPQILARQYDRHTPYVNQYVFNIQHSLAKNSVLEIGYTGNEGHHMERWLPVNFPLPGPGSVQANRPYPALALIQELQGATNSNYNALTAKFTQRLSNGFTALAAYTYSRAIDDGSGIRNHAGETDDFPQNVYALAAERAVSNYNQAQRFVTSLLWEPSFGKGKRWLSSGAPAVILGNWQVGSIVTLLTGLPFTVADGIDDANVGWTPMRPNYTGAALTPAGGQTPNQWFNPAAFVRPPQYTFGAVGRNTLVGPGLVSWDFSAMKGIQIRERQQVQFRFEAFNLPNRPNFSIPSSTIPSASVATITSTAVTMRQLQFSLKYVF